MICPGDRVLVCLSGGKDSLSLLHTLHQYQFIAKAKVSNCTRLITCSSLFVSAYISNYDIVCMVANPCVNSWVPSNFKQPIHSNTQICKWLATFRTRNACSCTACSRSYRECVLLGTSFQSHPFSTKSVGSGVWSWRCDSGPNVFFL